MSEQPLTSVSLPMRPLIVLDTNVVLDWLVFKDPSAAPWSAAVGHGQVRWIATAAMRDEFADVLRRGLAMTRKADPAGALATWDAHADLRAEPLHAPAALGLCCTDADDQKFLDLAHAAGARWLLSRDRAVLRLARSALRAGFAITVPERWSAVA